MILLIACLRIIFSAIVCMTILETGHEGTAFFCAFLCGVFIRALYARGL